MKNILLTGAYKYSDEQIEKIKEIGYKVTFIQDERVKLDIDVSCFSAVVCNSLFIYNDIKKFENLELIHLTSAGLDRVPLEYIKEKNITLCNASGVYSIPIAEWVILKILEVYKQSRQFHYQQGRKLWVKQRYLEELTGKNVAILGFGSIGQEIAKRIKPFNVNIISIDINDNNTLLRNNFVHINKLQETVSNMDVIILTLPLLESTRYLFDKNIILKMKKNSLLINVSRGEIINTLDLISVLQSRQDITAVLDVFEEEPLPNDNKLWSLPNVYVSPHNSYVSNLIDVRLFDLIYNNLKKMSEKGDKYV